MWGSKGHVREENMSDKAKPKGPPFLGEQSFEKQIGYFTVLMEDVQSHVKGIAENQIQLEQRLTNKIDSVETNLSGRIDMVELAIKATRSDLRDTEKRLDAKIDGVEKRLDGRMNGIDGRLDGIDGRLDGIEGKLDTMDKRLGSVEKKIDVVIEKVEKHDEDIIFLKSA